MISREDALMHSFSVNEKDLNFYVKKLVEPCKKIISNEYMTDKNKFKLVQNILSESLKDTNVNELKKLKDVNCFLSELGMGYDAFFSKSVIYAIESTTQMKEFRKNMKGVGYMKSKVKLNKLKDKTMSNHDELFVVLTQAESYFSNKKKKSNANKSKLNEVFGYAKQAREKMLKKAKKEETMER